MRNGLGKTEILGAIRDFHEEMGTAVRRLKRNQLMLAYFGTFLPDSGEKAREKRDRIAAKMTEREAREMVNSTREMLRDLRDIQAVIDMQGEM